jgi:hypothetical protein
VEPSILRFWAFARTAKATAIRKLIAAPSRGDLSLSILKFV